MKKQILIFISVSFFVLMICGMVSAASTTTISSDGKTIDVKYHFVNSTLKDNISYTKKTGVYGTGYYVNFTTTGVDCKNVTTHRTMIYFNKYKPSLYFIDFKSGFLKLSSSDGSWTQSNLIVNTQYKMTDTSTGRLSSNTTFSTTSNYTLYYLNGQRLIKNSVGITNFYKNNVYYGKALTTDICSYKSIGGSYQTVNDTVKINSFYVNGDTRTCSISSIYTRNTSGILIGVHTSGTSIGSEKINNKIVTYTGIITIGTKYDPKDTWNEKYPSGNYHESITSTSNLTNTLPFEAQ